MARAGSVGVAGDRSFPDLENTNGVIRRRITPSYCF